MTNTRKTLLASGLLALLPAGGGADVEAATRDLHADRSPMRAEESRFFADCRRQRRLRAHHDDRLLDAHGLLYSALNVAEIELIRLADWAVDLPIPGREIRPLERSVRLIRGGYHRLGSRLPARLQGGQRRVSELADALQIPELSLGDVAATQTAADGGDLSIGSGTLLRINRLIDWTQHVVGDLNRLAGPPVRRADGLIRWRMPGLTVDAAQDALAKGFHHLGVSLARLLDRGIRGAEDGAEMVVNLGRPTPHQQTTVFLRLPREVWQAHASWADRRRRHLYVGTSEELRTLTHAALCHPTPRQRRAARARPWGSPDRLQPMPDMLVVVMQERTMAKAPAALRRYVVPAAWVLHGIDKAEPGP